MRNIKARNLVMLMLLILLGAYVFDMEMFKSYFMQVLRGWEIKAV